MKKWFVLLSIVMVFTLLLAACGTGKQEERNEGAVSTAATSLESTATTGYGNIAATPVGTAVEITGTVGTTPEATVLPTEVATEAPTTAASTPAATAEGTAAPAGQGGTGTTRGAEILPATGRVEVTKLSTLLTFQVVDKNGNRIGKVDDMILNTCEAHILYLVVDPDASLKVQSGNLILIPYETVTLSQGKIDVQKKDIVVNLDATAISGVPSFSRDALDLKTLTWETDVMAFWKTHGPLQLTSECRLESQMTGTTSGTPEANPTATVAATPAVTGTPSGTTGATSASSVRKVISAKALLKADLQEGTGKSLGKVEEVILEPESGLLRYLAVRLTGNTQSGPGLVAVPFRAVNLDETKSTPENAVLVLLVETSVLNNAPVFNVLPDMSSNQWETDAFNYWHQYVPLTQDTTQP